jgi:hypothetical protein
MNHVHKGQIQLNPLFDKVAPKVRIVVQDKIIHDGILTERLCLDFDWTINDYFEMQVIKSGKDIEVVKNKQKQEVMIELLTLNNFNLYPSLFGIFYTNGNPFVEDKQIQTSQLTLNGTWKLRVPLFSLDGEPTLNTYDGFRDKITDSSIACFGCSFTYGYGSDYENTWPQQLSQLTGRQVRNYGRGGSNNQEIIANACEYVKQNKVDDVVILLCHASRLQLKKDNKLYNWHAGTDNAHYNMFPEQIDNVVNFGEIDVFFAGQVPMYLQKMKEIKSRISGKVYVSTYLEDHYRCLNKISCSDITVAPFFAKSKEYAMAHDNMHPGNDHYKIFAQQLARIITANDE